MEVMANIRVRRSRDRIESARIVADLAGWWNKPWDSHRSHVAMHDGVSGPLVKASLARRIGACLPGVGFVRSAAVAQELPTVEAMCEASVARWAEIDGIGKTMARRIYDAIRTR
jgi:ERCC4-type nuclease